MAEEMTGPPNPKDTLTPGLERVLTVVLSQIPAEGWHKVELWVYKKEDGVFLVDSVRVMP